MNTYKWRCPECETLNTDEECIICGYKKTSEKCSSDVIKPCFIETGNKTIKFSSAEKNIQEQGHEQVTVKERNVWFCSKCGMKNKKIDLHCSRCGYDRGKLFFIIGRLIVAFAVMIITLVLITNG